MNDLRLELTEVNEARMVYRRTSRRERPQIATSAVAYSVLLPFFDETMDMREEFWVLLLDRGNRAKTVYRLSQGGLNGTVADPRLIFAAAIKTLSCAIILAHNHPSGQLRPSEEDIRLTRKLCEGARLLDLTIHDHVIMTRDGYYSFADNGMLS